MNVYGTRLALLPRGGTGDGPPPSHGRSVCSGRSAGGAPAAGARAPPADYAFTAVQRSAEQDGRGEVFRNARKGIRWSVEPSDDPHQDRRGEHVARDGSCRQVDVQTATLRGADTDRDGQRHVGAGTSATISHLRGSGSRRATRSIQQLDGPMSVAAETQRQSGRERSCDDAQAQYKPEEQADREAHVGGTMGDLVATCKLGRCSWTSVSRSGPGSREANLVRLGEDVQRSRGRPRAAGEKAPPSTAVQGSCRRPRRPAASRSAISRSHTTPGRRGARARRT
jgi:hypothetical protein